MQGRFFIGLIQAENRSGLKRINGSEKPRAGDRKGFLHRMDAKES
jgi:hypothetical protein